MAESSVLHVGFVNIVATPHPAGVYPKALKAIANKPVNYRGKDFAIITPPMRNKKEENIHRGNISVWTDVDSSEPSIDKATFKKKDVEAALKKIFAERGFNNREFTYFLEERSHTLVVELRNERGQTISVRQAGKIFELLLSSLNKEGQTYVVTVRPSEDAIEQVLAFKRLDRIKIVLKRPNPGDHDGGDADEVLRELEEQNMKEADYIFSRQPGTDGIRLNEVNQTRAEVAAENGYVESSGVDADDVHDRRSTKEYPRIVKHTLAAGATFVSTLRDEARKLRGK
jgi:hypothetical protein